MALFPNTVAFAVKILKNEFEGDRIQFTVVWLEVLISWSI